MRRLCRAIDHVSEFLGLAAAQLYLLCALITTYEVVMRYVFHAPTQWAFEVVMVLCASAWMLSVGYVTRHRRHIAITVLYGMVPPRVRWVLDLLINLVAIAAVGFLLYSVWEPAVRAIGRIERSGSAFNAPEPTVLKTMLVIGAALYLLQLVANLVKHVRDEDEEAPPLADEGE